MYILRRSLASLSLASFLLNPLSAYALMIPNGEEVSIPTLLSASDYGITETATELPAERTLRTATFDLGNGKRAQVSVSQDLFTHNPHQPDSIVFANSKGEKQGNSFVFDYLPQDTRVSFDLTKPSYTLSKGTHSFTLSFPTQSSIEGTILNDHQISYPLSENATLVWTVDGTNVKKEIHVKNTGTNPTFPFSISSSLTKSLQNNSIILSDGSQKIFQTEKPYLLTTNYYPLLNSVSLIENSLGNFEYVYDESALPSEYILDPDTGLIEPGTVVSDNTVGSQAWINPGNLVSGGSFAQIRFTEGATVTSEYVKATNFGFSIPDGSTILGIRAEFTPLDSLAYNQSRTEFGYNEECTVTDSNVRIVKGGTFGSVNKTGFSNGGNWSYDSTVTRQYGSEDGSYNLNDLWSETWTAADINSSNFGVALSVSGTCSGSSSSGYYFMGLQTMAMKIQYAAPSCNVPAECGTTTNGCVSGICDACSDDSQCASGNCNEGTGECAGSPTGSSCTTSADCLTGACINGYCTGVCGWMCASMTLPAGYGIMKQSDNSIVSFTDLTSASTPIWIVKDPTGVKTKIMSLAVARYSGGSACDYSGFTVDTNTSTYKSIFHDGANNLDFGTAGRKYSLYIPKSASHDRVRLCSGKTSIGCTSSDSWSFLANDAGSIVSTNGGFNTTGITVSVSGSYWIVTGLTGTSGEGESSGGGGGGGDVPSFSTIGLLILLGGCYMMMMRKGELLDA